MQPEYTKVKVHNEIELCETTDMEMKQQIERILLRNRISYYIKWHKQGLFKRNKNVCVFCVNANSKEEAEELVRSLSENIEDTVRFLLRKAGESYF